MVVLRVCACEKCDKRSERMLVSGAIAEHTAHAASRKGSADGMVNIFEVATELEQFAGTQTRIGRFVRTAVNQPLGYRSILVTRGGILHGNSIDFPSITGVRNGGSPWDTHL